jgi:PAS domain S-box-containing protein
VNKKLEEIIQNPAIRSLLDAMGDGVSIQGTDFKIVYQNRRAKEIIGEHTGSFCFEVYEQHVSVCQDCPLEKTFQDGQTYTVERINPSRPLTVEITTSPIRDEEGKIIAGIEVVRDITERIKTEKAFRESVKKYRDIVDNSLVGIYTTTLKGDILYINEALADMFEFNSPSEMMKLGVSSLYKNPSDRKTFLDALQKTGSIMNFEIEALTKTGKTINLMFSATLSDTVISGMIMDITRRKRSEQSERREKEKARKYLDIVGVIVLVLDVHGNVSLINKSGCEILGYQEQDIIGRNWFEHFLPEHTRKEVSEVFQMLMGGKADLVRFFENPVTTNRGEERLIAWHNTLLHDEEGNISGTLSSGEDITFRKKIEQDHKERLQELEQFYEMSIGRELKMKELKTQIERLKGELREKSL